MQAKWPQVQTCSPHAAQLVGVCTALLLIDRLGRRPLLIGGSAVCCLAMLAIAAADAAADVPLLLAGMCTFIVAFRHASSPLYDEDDIPCSGHS